MIVKEDFWYERANDYRKLHIYLPDNYDNSNDSYPVMYFFDGHNLYFDEDATYGKSWGLKSFLDDWHKDMIIVGMECGHKKDERMNEYLPYDVPAGFLSEYDGYGDETIQWIINDVKPYIDKNYRTMPFRECTGIAGSSMGGLMSVYAVINYNNWFSKAACLSSSIMTCITQVEDDIEDNKLNPDTRVYLSWGSIEAFRSKNPHELDTNSYTYKCNRATKTMLNEKDVNAQMYCQVNGAHCEADWEKQVPLFMDYLWCERNIENV